MRWVVTPSCECCGMRWPRAPCQRKWVQKKQQNRTGGEADGRRGESWGAREPLDSPRGPLAPLTRGRGGVGGRNGGGVSSRSTRAPAFVTRGCCQHTASYLVHSAGWGFCACTYTQSSSPARPRKYPSPVEPLRPPSPRAHGVSGDVGATPPPRGCPHLASGGGGAGAHGATGCDATAGASLPFPPHASRHTPSEDPYFCVGVCVLLTRLGGEGGAGASNSR